MGVVAVPKRDFPPTLQDFNLLINRIHTIIVLIVLLPLPTSVIYFVSFEAETFAEYAEGLLFCAATCLQMTFYFVVMFNRPELMKLMEEFQETGQKSKCWKKENFKVTVQVFWCWFLYGHYRKHDTEESNHLLRRECQIAIIHEHSFEIGLNIRSTFRHLEHSGIILHLLHIGSVPRIIPLTFCYNVICFEFWCSELSIFRILVGSWTSIFSKIFNISNFRRDNSRPGSSEKSRVHCFGISLVRSVHLDNFFLKWKLSPNENIIWYFFRIPWNWKTPSTYLAAVCLQCFWLYSTGFMVVCSLSLFSGFCLSLCANAIDIRDGFVNLKSTDENHNSVKGKLFDLIQFHSKSIELSLNLCLWFFTFFELIW